MPQSYDFIFISARDFWEKLQEKLEIAFFSCDRTRGLYATMNRWRIDYYFFLFIPHIPHVFQF